MKNNEQDGDIKKLKDYLQRTEARNIELEATIRTLHRKISLLEGSGHRDVHEAAGPPGHVPNANYNAKPEYVYSEREFSETHRRRPANDLIEGIHQRVTNFVLNKVSQQINYLELLDSTVQETQIPTLTPSFPFLEL